MVIQIVPFDPAEYLNDDEAIAAFLQEAAELNDADFLRQCIAIVERARGLPKVRRDAGLAAPATDTGTCNQS